MANSTRSWRRVSAESSSSADRLVAEAVAAIMPLPDVGGTALVDPDAQDRVACSEPCGAGNACKPSHTPGCDAAHVLKRRERPAHAEAAAVESVSHPWAVT